MLKKILYGCRKRQRDSQRDLYRMYYAYGMSIALRYSGTRDQAVVILNDAFIKVFDNIRKYDPKRPFKPWLRKIIVNTAIDHYHREKKYEKELIDLERIENMEEENEAIISGISYDEIVEMIRQLSPAYRAVFNLHVIEGYSHDEIAEMLDISAGTSKSNLAKAKRNLRVILEKNLI